MSAKKIQSSGGRRNSRTTDSAKGPKTTTLRSLRDTKRLAQQWAKRLKPGTVVALAGELGAGKTTFVRFLAQSLGFHGQVTSPTFTLANHYRGRLPLYHIDCYRLNQHKDLAGAGLEDLLPSADGVTLVEWADKFPEYLPVQTLMLEFSISGETQRQVRYRVLGT